MTDDIVKFHVVPNFDWNAPTGINVIMTNEQQKIIEDYHAQGINPVFAPAWEDGKLMGFGMIPAERASHAE